MARNFLWSAEDGNKYRVVINQFTSLPTRVYTCINVGTTGRTDCGRVGGLTCRRVLRSGVRVELGSQMNGRTNALVNNRELDQWRLHHYAEYATAYVFFQFHFV